MSRKVLIIIFLGFSILLGLLFLLPDGRKPYIVEPEVVDERIVKFYNDCVKQTLRSAPLETCRSFETMSQAYDVRPMILLTSDLGKMVMTAKKIVRGDIVSEEQYRSCIYLGVCAEIPMIPEKQRDNPDYLKTSKGRKIHALFWHLINDGSLNKDLCDFMDICKAYLKLGLIEFNDEGFLVR